MKSLNKFPKEFFDKYEEKPVRLIPYSDEMKFLAEKYLQELESLLSGQEVELGTIGSVAYKIPASDVEIAVYANDKNWDEILDILKNKFGDPVNLDNEFARFKIRAEIYKFSIHVYRGYEGEVTKKMTDFMVLNPNLIEEYKNLKEKYCFSQKEYQYQKNAFLEKVIEQIPE
jgi:hypothetical protein